MQKHSGIESHFSPESSIMQEKLIFGNDIFNYPRFSIFIEQKESEWIKCGVNEYTSLPTLISRKGVIFGQSA